MRTLVLVFLVIAGCKSANKEPEALAPAPVVTNAALAARLEAFGRDESEANFTAALDTLRTAKLFIALKPTPNGGGQAAIKVDPKRGQVLYAFLEQASAAAFWAGVEGVTIAPTPAPGILEVAAFEQTDELILDPQLPDRSLIIPRENYAAISKAWASVAPADSGTLH